MARPIHHSPLNGEKNWIEAGALSDLLNQAGGESPENLLYGAQAALERGDTDKARRYVRQAKMLFGRNPQERVQLETRNPALFWKVGYLLREPGA